MESLMVQTPRTRQTRWMVMTKRFLLTTRATLLTQHRHSRIIYRHREQASMRKQTRQDDTIRPRNFLLSVLPTTGKAKKRWSGLKSRKAGKVAQRYGPHFRELGLKSIRK